MWGSGHKTGIYYRKEIIMTIEKKEPHAGHHASCANRNAPNLWIIGTIVVALVIFFCYALFSKHEKIPSMEEMPQEVMAMSGIQQAAFVPPGCATCPTVTNCFPGAAGSAQQIALMNPNCSTCPSVTNCFPGAAAPAQQAAFTRPNCPIRPYGTQNYSGNAIQPIAFGAQAAQPIPGIAPVIFRDALMPHEYRGVCELCHIVKPDIAISINAQMPHVYRGVCSNCHLIQ